MTLKELFTKYAFEYVSVPCIQNGKDLQEFRLSLGNDIAEKIQVIAKIDTTTALQ